VIPEFVPVATGLNTPRHFVMESKGIEKEDNDVIAIAIKEEQARKDQKPWPITTEEAAEFAAQVFGLTGIDVSKVKEFVSYDDRNYFLPSVSYLNAQTNVSETLDVIFKVHNGVESENEPLIRAHNYVLSQVFQSGVNVPEPLPIKTGADTIGWIDLKLIRDPSNTRRHAVRLLRFIPGVIIDQSEEESPELLKHLGSFVGKMDRVLLQLPEVPKGLEGRILLWDLKNVPALSRFSECIIDLDNRALQVQQYK
jgi:Ser/Thr protein kinase RdoA (MazF antagonist)